MMRVADKAAHVRGAGQGREHHCHWPGCPAEVPPAMWGCRKHWFKLPADLRGEIWRTYRPGQEDSMTPSREYVAVALRVQDWIATNHPETKQKDLKL